MPMSDTVVVTGGESESEEVSDAIEEVADAAEEMADAIDDAVMDGTTIQLVERVTRLEDTVTVMGATIQEIAGRLDGLAVTDEVQQQEIQEVAREVEEVATEAADAIQESVAEVEEASEEITPDELPTQREHPFFRKWGKR